MADLLMHDSDIPNVRSVLKVALVRELTVEEARSALECLARIERAIPEKHARELSLQRARRDYVRAHAPVILGQLLGAELSNPEWDQTSRRRAIEQAGLLYDETEAASG